MTFKASWSALIIILTASCNKAKTEESGISEATYKVTLTGKWTAPAFIIPPNAHFTFVTGMLHNSSVFQFRPGSLASVSAERIAEDRNSIPMLAEIDSLIGLKKAASDFIIFTPSINGPVSSAFSTSSSFPLFSCMSMIAPTPDWFIGVHDLNLMPSGKWLSDTTINLYVYDAGTEDGNVLGQSNPDTNPHQPVSLLTVANGSALANGTTVLAPIATLRLQKQ